MQNKPRSRTDVQWVISSISLAATLGLWSLFASHDRKVAAVSAEAVIPPPPDQVMLSQPQMLLPGQKLLFAGTAPQPQAPQIVITRKTRNRGGGGGGGGGGASTGSSR